MPKGSPGENAMRGVRKMSMVNLPQARRPPSQRLRRGMRWVESGSRSAASVCCSAATALRAGFVSSRRLRHPPRPRDQPIAHPHSDHPPSPMALAGVPLSVGASRRCFPSGSMRGSWRRWARGSSSTCPPPTSSSRSPLRRACASATALGLACARVPARVVNPRSGTIRAHL